MGARGRGPAVKNCANFVFIESCLVESHLFEVVSLFMEPKAKFKIKMMIVEIKVKAKIQNKKKHAKNTQQKSMEEIFHEFQGQQFECQLCQSVKSKHSWSLVCYKT